MYVGCLYLEINVLYHINQSSPLIELACVMDLCISQLIDSTGTNIQVLRTVGELKFWLFKLISNAHK
jgi:hypothetical protein